MCVFVALFRMRAWSVTATILMINLKRTVHSFVVWSRIIIRLCFLTYTSLTTLFEWSLRSRLFFEERWWRLPSSPSAWPHFLFIVIHYVYVCVDLPFLRADDAIKWLFTDTLYVKGSSTTIERNKLNLNFSIVSGRGEWQLCLVFVRLHI